MKRTFYPVLLFLLIAAIAQNTFAQGVGVNSTGSAPDNSAGLDVNFNNKGFLMPRIRQGQRDSISSPALGLMIYNINSNCFEFYNGTFWQPSTCSCSNPPAMAGAITGITLYCYGQSGVRYFISSLPSAISYTWSVPAGATILNGQGTTSISVDFGSAYNGDISVFAVNTCGNGAASYLSVQSINAIPANPGVISGVNSAVNNQTGVSYAIAPATGTGYYNWSVPSGSVIASGQGTNSILVNFGSVSGNICVTDSNGCGASNTQCASVSLSSSCPVHGSATYAYTASNQAFNVPTCVSSITIEATGGQGGDHFGISTGGKGADIKGTFAVTPGSSIGVIAGQQGQDGCGNVANCGAGGGGGSFVYSGSTLLVAAGGGGGGSLQNDGHPKVDGDGGQTSTCGSSSKSCFTGGCGGANGFGDLYGNGWNTIISNPAGNGTWGGYGGGGDAQDHGGGGGGGYSGGGGSSSGSCSTYGDGGGGGGSYNGGSNQSNSAGTHSGDGQITFTW